MAFVKFTCKDCGNEDVYSCYSVPKDLCGKCEVKKVIDKNKKNSK